MKKPLYIFILCISILILIFALGSCLLNSTTDFPEETSTFESFTDYIETPTHYQETPTPELTSEPTEIPTEEQTENPTVEITNTPTNTPIPTDTLVPTPTPTPTPIPDHVTEIDELSMDPHKNPYKTIEGEYVKDIILSEVISKNSQYVPLNGEYYDIVELYNASNESINLSSYYLSDSKKDYKKYNLPNITLKAGEYYIVYCAGNEGKDNEAPFKISSEGEKLYLTKNDSTYDRVTVPEDLKKNMSYARYGEEWVYSVIPTIGEPNSNGHLTQLAAPIASLVSGVYSESIQVVLSSEGVIKYTLDGTKPNEDSPSYKGALTISSSASIRCYSVKNGEKSDESTYTYVISDGHDLPVVNISMPMESFNKVSKNIKEDYEEEALFTLIENGVEKFSVACGFKLHGNDSRNGRKQNFTLNFKSKYGVGKLNYKVFDNLDIEKFNSLLLKGGSEDFPNAIIRDVYCGDIASNSGNLYTQATKPVVLYIAGEYWGIYFITEKLDESYIASHLGVSENNMDIIKAWYENEAGSYNDYYNLVQYCKKHDLNVEEYYNYVANKCDVYSYMDWFIFRSFFGDHDNANWRCFKSSEGDNKFHLMYFDMDWAMWKSVNEKTFTWMMNQEDDDVMAALVKSKIFQKAMLERVDELSTGVLSSEFLSSRLEYYVNLLSSEIERDQKRWGLDIENWRKQIEVLRKYVRDGNRMKYFKEDVKGYLEKS